MTWIAQVIADFGASIGLPSLSLDADGHLELAWGSEATIAIMHCPEELGILVSVAQAQKPEGGRQLRQALRLADRRYAGEWTAYAYLLDDRLALGVRIPERSLTLPALEQALSALAQNHRTMF